MLRQRLITGPILIALLVLLVEVDARGIMGSAPGMVFAVVFAMLVPIAAGEAASLVRACGTRCPSGLAIAASLAMYLASLVASKFTDPILAIGVAMLGPVIGFGIALVGLAMSRRIGGAFVGATAIAGIGIWTGLLPAFWILAIEAHGAWLVAGLVLVVKAGDIGAYFTGMLVGRRKLIEWLSPKKTIEGGLGGLAFAAAAGAGVAILSRGAVPAAELGLAAGIVGGVLLAVVGAGGDLVESLLKRAAGAKDSGSVLPGMGGILDVLDSPLAAGPVAWIILQVGTRG
ncbi:MAG: hypothetical protein CMJ52_03430 [Planctomycetaceae bacterium]|nr:hypothetical protein [Planctomycetaceae bacterium]